MDEKYWLEIGHLVSNIRFNAVITKSTNSKLGYRLQLKMWNSNDSKYGSPLEKILGKKRVMYTSNSDIEKVIIFLDKIQKTYGFSTHRKSDVHLVRYCLDNPPNYDSWSNFLKWIEDTEQVFGGLAGDLVIKELED